MDANTLSDENTKDELLGIARDLDIEGRSEMTKDELAEAILDAQDTGDEGTADATAPGPLRPAQGETNPKVAGPPPVADQPGLGRAANPEPAPGPTPNLSVSRIGAAKDAARERAQEHREELAASQG